MFVLLFGLDLVVWFCVGGLLFRVCFVDLFVWVWVICVIWVFMLV